MNDDAIPSWSLLKRIGFRFLFSFLLLAIIEPFGLFGKMTGMSRLGGPWERLVKWIGQLVFQVQIEVLPMFRPVADEIKRWWKGCGRLRGGL